MKSIVGSVIFVLLCPAPAAAEIEVCVPSADRTIAVTGGAMLRLPPDRAAFSVGVESTADSVSEAFAANNAKVQRLLAALKREGVDPKAIQTSNLQVASRDHRGQQLPGFRVSNLVTVTLEKPGAVGELLQVAVSAGANRIGGLRFFVAESGRHNKRGLELAFADARAKAEVLAALAGQRLGEVLCVSETTGGNRPLEYAVSRADAAVPIESGSETMGFSIDVVFALE